MLQGLARPGRTSRYELAQTGPVRRGWVLSELEVVTVLERQLLLPVDATGMQLGCGAGWEGFGGRGPGGEGEQLGQPGPVMPRNSSVPSPRLQSASAPLRFMDQCCTMAQPFIGGMLPESW